MIIAEQELDDFLDGLNTKHACFSKSRPIKINYLHSKSEHPNAMIKSVAYIQLLRRNVFAQQQLNILSTLKCFECACEQRLPTW